jgi:hypothetical protein
MDKNVDFSILDVCEPNKKELFVQKKVFSREWQNKKSF